MKILKFYILLFFGTMLVSSCGENLANLNVDPNSSSTARPSEVLTAGMGYLGIGLEGYMNETNAVLAQYWTGGPGVNIIDLDRYFIEPGDFSTEWAFMTNQALSDLDFVLDNGNSNRSDIANLVSVYIFQILVDSYGDIPYSEALKGALDDGSILTPKYDNDEEIYTDLIARVDASLESLGQSDDEIGTEDLIYSGDISKWIKFANSLKLKLLMRQSITNGAAVSQSVKDLIANGTFISSAEDMAVIPFLGDAGNWNPMFARREQGIKQFYVASNSSVKLLEELADPRLSVLYDAAVGTGTIVGLDQGFVNDLVSPSKDDYSYPSAVQYGNDKDVILMSHWEVMFLRAEAAMRFATADDETSMFDNAVTAHFDYIGAGGASDYLTTNAVYDAGASESAKSDLIGTQKWISMHGLQETEGWIEARRFDTPSSNIFTNTGSGIWKTPTRSVLADGVFPSIRLYPQSELSFNPNAPTDRKLTDKVFWDN